MLIVSAKSVYSNIQVTHSFLLLSKKTSLPAYSFLPGKATTKTSPHHLNSCTWDIN